MAEGTPIAVDSRNPTTLYLSVHGGGLARSTNGGETWSFLNSGLPTWPGPTAGITSVAIDPRQPSTLYAATRGLWPPRGHGVFKSINGGETWVPLNNGLTALTVESLVISSGPTATLYAGTTGGAFRILDEHPQRAQSSPKISLDSTRYCTGDSWKLQITSEKPNQWVHPAGTQNGLPWEGLEWGQTGSGGSLTKSGTFLQNTEGAYTMWATIDDTISNTIAFEVSRCGPYID